MENVDRGRINAIILRESGDSLFMRQQRRRDARVDVQISELKRVLANADPNWRRDHEARCDVDAAVFLAARPTRSACVVVDMDMFYMACALQSRPHLSGFPACVGHGMILTSNYRARKYGVRSAMAGWIGDKLVAELSGGKERLVHVDSDFDLYKKKSNDVKAVLTEYDPRLKMCSLDEAYMDFAPYLALKISEPEWDHDTISRVLGGVDPSGEGATVCTTGVRGVPVDPYEILSSLPERVCAAALARVVHEMRGRVRERTGLTCSAGLAPNFLLAKIASDVRKPDGQYLVSPSHDAVNYFLHPLPVRKVGGIGRVRDKILGAFGIKNVKDLYRERALVHLLFKEASASFLLRASVGCSSSDSGESDDGPQKGIGKERTFRAGQSWAETVSRLEDIALGLSEAMQKKELWARTVTVKAKLHTFDVVNRSRSVPRGVFLQSSQDLAAHATSILDEIRRDFGKEQFSLRLLGIRCTNFKDAQDGEETSIVKYLTKPRSATAAAAAQSQPSKNSPPSEKKYVDLTEESVPDPIETAGIVSCPVCQRKFPADENDALNVHIDACLSGGLIRETVHEESLRHEQSKVAGGKRRRITDFW